MPKVETAFPEEIGISSIVSAELWFGGAHSQKKKQNEAALRDFFKYATVLNWPNEAAPFYGRIRSVLQKRGAPIGALDLLIVAHSLYLDATLVTNNTREFSRVPGLKIENWIEQVILRPPRRPAAWPSSGQAALLFSVPAS